MPILTSLGGMSVRGFGRIKSSRAPVTLTDTFTLPNSDTKYVVGDIINFTKPADTAQITASNGIYTFPVRNGINFRIKLYGAAGGYFNNATSQYGSNSNGGIMDALINLQSYQNGNLYIVRGGGGQNATVNIDGSPDALYAGGFNGAGWGSGTGGPGGGGRTDLRTGNPSGTASTNNLTELLVAAGGGGGIGSYGQSGNRYWGNSGCSGVCGCCNCDNGGGGGGYYGGGASCGDDERNGGSGTNYYDAGKTVTVYTNSIFNSNSGGNAGHGYFSIEVVSVS